jgi:hypothetical protein
VTLPILVGPSTVTINRDDRFLVCQPDGRVTEHAEEGFFARDTSFVSGWDLLVNGQRPLLLNSSPIEFRLAHASRRCSGARRGALNGPSRVRRRLIHMAELDTKARNKLRRSQFAYVDSEGAEHLPINDEAHIRNAMARFNQTDFESTSKREGARRKIVSAAKKHGIEIDKDDNIAKPVRSGGHSKSS